MRTVRLVALLFVTSVSLFATEVQRIQDSTIMTDAYISAIAESNGQRIPGAEVCFLRVIPAIDKTCVVADDIGHYAAQIAPGRVIITVLDKGRTISRWTVQLEALHYRDAELLDSLIPRGWQLFDADTISRFKLPAIPEAGVKRGRHRPT